MVLFRAAIDPESNRGAEERQLPSAETEGVYLLNLGHAGESETPPVPPVAASA